MTVVPPVAALRDYASFARTGSLRALVWRYGEHRALARTLREPRNARVLEYVRTEQERSAAALRSPHAPDDQTRLDAAVAWLLAAQRATPDDGVSLGYFPLDAEGTGWRPSYPETTGYIISTLLAYAARRGRPDVERAALAMADWEIAVQMPSGAVQGGPLAAPDKQFAAAFNTGMVLDGWCSAYERSGAARYLEAAGRAARFLAGDLDDLGYFRTNGAFVGAGEIKTYTCLCAWAMMRYARLADDADVAAAALKAGEAALRQQAANGWFAHNCLTNSRAPLTHTIGYAVQGLYELGRLAERRDFVDAAQAGLAAALARVDDKGWLAGRLDHRWRPSAGYVCLTGSCQLAAVAYRIAGVNGSSTLTSLADRALAFVKATQRLDAPDPAMNGAIAGSFPLLGAYMTGGFPNWATKYFIDALMLRQDVAVNPRA